MTFYKKAFFLFFLSYSRCSVPQVAPSVLEDDKSECPLLVLGLLIKEISSMDPFCSDLLLCPSLEAGENIGKTKLRAQLDLSRVCGVYQVET